MSGINQAIATLTRSVDRAVSRVTPFRATVTDVDGHLVEIQRVESATPDSRMYASCARSFLLGVGDVVLCANINGEPVIIDKIGILPASGLDTGYTLLGNAGDTATASIVGDDHSGTLTVTPNGSGISSGTFVQLDFAATRPSTAYAVKMQRADLVAGDVDVRVTGKTTTRFRLYAPSALTSGQTYVWDYQIAKYGN